MLSYNVQHFEYVTNAIPLHVQNKYTLKWIPTTEWNELRKTKAYDLFSETARLYYYYFSYILNYECI